MKTIVRKLLLIQFILASVISGCASDPITIKSYQAKDLILTSGHQVSSEACGFQLLMLIPIKINSRYERAFDDLIELAPNEAITSLSIQEDWTYCYVGTLYCTKLRATAYKKTANK